MPYTPFHLPPTALAGWPVRRHLDLPTLLVANLTIDLEPLAIRVFDLGPPPHGYAHTLLGATVVGAATGWLVWRGKRLLERVFRKEYPLTPRAAVVSGVAGCWLHVALDAVMYSHIRPFFPLDANPLHWPGSSDALHVICALLLLPAVGLCVRHRYWQTLPQKLSVGLLAVAAIGMAGAVAAGEV
jgi:membrane-bound metal-dependent hydrolase YbcI (DUF457 family)